MTAWLAAGGEEQVVDYLCPQVYWGYGFTLQSGSTRFAFENIVPGVAWRTRVRRDVALYFGLGAYRVGAGRRRREPGQRDRLEHRRVCWPAQVQDLRQSGRRAAGRCTATAVCSVRSAPEQAAAECAALRALTGRRICAEIRRQTAQNKCSISCAERQNAVYYNLYLPVKWAEGCTNKEKRRCFVRKRYEDEKTGSLALLLAVAAGSWA